MPAARESVDPLDDLVAPAGRRLEAGAVEYADIAPVVADQLLPLQGAGGPGHGNPQHAQHVAEYLLRDMKIVRSHAVARHQQPAREAVLHEMETVACRDLSDLDQSLVYVLVQRSMQGPVPSVLAQETTGRHAQGRSASLYHRKRRRLVYSQRQGYAEHAFAADQADFQRHMAFHRGEQGHQRVARKVDMADWLSHFVDDLAGSQRDRLEGEQALVLPQRQGSEQAVRYQRAVHSHRRVFIPVRLPRARADVCALANTGAS